LALRISDAAEVPEFMTKLGTIKEMAMAEPLTYGSTLNDVKGGEAPSAIAAKYLPPPNPVPVRLTALSWYFRHGAAANLEGVKRFQADTAKIPGCAKDAKDCEWKCEFAVNGKTEPKDITTLGEFVRYCVVPEMERRATGDAAKK
jgi:hypothetical protein